MTASPRRWNNPLDWRPIDRHILLGTLLLLVPLVFGGWLAGTLWLAPSYLNASVALALLALYGLHGVLLMVLLLQALRRRRAETEWPLLENVVIISFVISILAGSYAAGTQYTQGLLVLFLGFNIASALTSIRKIYVAYVCVCAVLLVIAIVDFTGATPHAPMFSRPPLEADGSLTTAWLIFQVMVAAVLLALTRITIAVINRWVERENLYREMSSIDGLTRLTNRRSFIERGQSEIRRAQRTALHNVACVLVDLDHFKSINDTWGHHVGDEVLVAASNILMENTREYDEVGRYGGEEFAILMPGLSLAEASAAAERIRDKIAGTPVLVDGQAIHFTASFGVACFPALGVDSLNELLKAADRALYQAKDQGRNRVVTVLDGQPTN